MEQFKSEFSAIDSVKALMQFVARHALTEAKDVPLPSQTYAVYRGVAGGRQVQLTHRWHDPSGPFQNEPDIEKVDLHVDGARVGGVEWQD